jgi:putative membrane protein insertion efficiency factor
MLKKIILSLIRVYQKISPIFNTLGRSLGLTKTDCKFIPSCSNYAIEAVNKHGAFKGTYLGFIRVLRCHPFAKGGYDPVK